MRQWRDQLQSDWGGEGRRSLDMEMEREEALYFQDYRVPRPKGQFAVRTGSAPADAEGAIDSLVPGRVQITVTKPRATERWQTLADKRTRFAYALLHQWRYPRDLWALLPADQVIRRLAVARVLWDQRLWPERPKDWKAMTEEAQDHWEEDHRSRCPIVMECRNPRYVRFRDMQDGTLMAVCEHYPMLVADAIVTFAAYPKIRQILGGREGMRETVWIDDVWVGEYRCLLVEDQPLWAGKDATDGVVKSPYPEIPYVVMPYRELNFEAPGERYRGMLTNTGDLYRYESEVLGMVTQMTRWNAWRTWKGWFTKDRDEAEIVPGSIIMVAKHQNEYLEALTGETFPPDIIQPIQLYDGYIGRNSVVFGGAASGEQARGASQQWAQQAQRQLKMERAKSALQTGMAQCFRLATQIGERFLGEETLVLPLPGRDQQGQERGQVAIKRGDLAGYPDCYKVSFGARMDPAMLELNKGLQVMHQNGVMPLRAAHELGGMVEVAQDWIDDLRLEKLEQHPAMQAMALLEQAEAYFKDEPEKAALAKTLIMQLAQGGGGQPQGAGVPQPGGQQPPGQRPGGPPQGAGGRKGGGGRGRMGGGRTNGRPPGLPAAGTGGLSR